MGPLRGCTRLHTHIRSKDFSAWLQFFWQTPLFAPESSCPMPGYPEIPDIHGDQWLHCRYERQRNTRHNSQVALLGNDLAWAARRPFIESRVYHQHRTRPYIRAMGAAGDTDYFDVSFVNPPAPSHSRVRTFNPLTSLNPANAEKQQKYQCFRAELPGRSRLVPVPIYTLSGWHPGVVFGRRRARENRCQSPNGTVFEGSRHSSTATLGDKRRWQ